MTSFIFYKLPQTISSGKFAYQSFRSIYPSLLTSSISKSSFICLSKNINSWYLMAFWKFSKFNRTFLWEKIPCMPEHISIKPFTNIKISKIKFKLRFCHPIFFPSFELLMFTMPLHLFALLNPFCSFRDQYQRSSLKS